MVDAALAAIPSWLSREKTATTMAKRKKRKEAEMTRDNFAHKANTLYRNNKFKGVWKHATEEYHSNKTGPTPSKHGFGALAVAKKYNKLLASPGDKKIGKMALINALKRGEIGLSPRKQGRPTEVPRRLTMALATHATMMQVSGEAEASGAKMTATVEALVYNTKWQDKLDPGYVWRKTRTAHPDILNPVQAKNHEDRRVDWLSYSNINTWITGAKDYLVSIGMLLDVPGEICEFQFIHQHYYSECDI